jgi:hypothetical protein
VTRRQFKIQEKGLKGDGYCISMQLQSAQGAPPGLPHRHALPSYSAACTGWSCARCTFTNSHLLQECEACGAPREAWREETDLDLEAPLLGRDSVDHDQLRSQPVPGVGGSRRPTVGDKVKFAPGSEDAALSTPGTLLSDNCLSNGRIGQIIEDSHPFYDTVVAEERRFKVKSGGETTWYRENQGSGW